MIISFAWTLEPLMAGRKQRTSRDWSERHMAAWQHAWDEGRLIHQAWDKSPRAGGKRIGYIQLTGRPQWERLGDVTEANLEAEGWSLATRAPQQKAIPSAGPPYATREEFIELMGGDAEKRVAVVWFVWMGEEES